jgi:hypothetical protein
MNLTTERCKAPQKLGFPAVATKNTTRVAGGDPVADAAGVALAVYPSAGSGTHPGAVARIPLHAMWFRGSGRAGACETPPLDAGRAAPLLRVQPSAP